MKEEADDWCDASDVSLLCQDVSREWIETGGEPADWMSAIPSCFDDDPAAAGSGGAFEMHDGLISVNSSYHMNDIASPDCTWHVGLDDSSAVEDQTHDAPSIHGADAEPQRAAVAASAARHAASAASDGEHSGGLTSVPEAPLVVVPSAPQQQVPAQGQMMFGGGMMVPVVMPPSAQHPQGCVMMMLMQRMPPSLVSVPAAAAQASARETPVAIAAPPAPSGTRSHLRPAASQASLMAIAPEGSLEERREARQLSLERYRAKKARRLSSNKIRYHLRKVNADNRPRVKGRFVRKSELCEVKLEGEQCMLPQQVGMP